MNTTTYIINGILVLLVLRQIRERRLDLRSLLQPVALVGLAALHYLHSIPTTGNDLVLELSLTAIGATMGALCAWTTHIRLDHDGSPLARAGVVAASLWIAGVGARMGFGFAASHGLGPSIHRFSVDHAITGSAPWVAALILMALADVATRLLVLHLRGRRLASASGLPIVTA